MKIDEIDRHLQRIASERTNQEMLSDIERRKKDNEKYRQELKSLFRVLENLQNAILEEI